MNLPDEDYARLLALRTGLRHFLRWSEQQARAAGLTPAQHQLLLAIRGHGDARGPTVGEVADYLLLRHHSTVELVDRADAAGLVSRRRDPDDHRVVRLQLTEAAAERLERLSALHLEELKRLALRLPSVWKGLPPRTRAGGSARAAGRTGAGRGARRSVEIARVYDLADGPQRDRRVLVDRLWPRGLRKDEAPFGTWAKDVAPSTELRTWYGHDPDRFAEFGERYRRELAEPPARAALEELRGLAGRGGVVLVTATKDVDRSAAAVLRELLAG